MLFGLIIGNDRGFQSMEEVNKNRRKNRQWRKIAFEIFKWVLVLWLLWPMRHSTEGPIEFARVVAGILLFVIFTGKLFYDTIIMGIVKQKRNSARQDIITILGIVIALALVVGLVIVFVGYLLIEIQRMSSSDQQ